jgi:hypothetical protein
VEEKIPVVPTTKGTKAVEVVPAKTGTTAPETKEAQTFRAALPKSEDLAKAILADLEKDLRTRLATDPALKGLTKAELSEWVAADVAETFAELSKRGWGAE